MTMTDTAFIDAMYIIASSYDPDINETTEFQEIINTLDKMKDKALKFELIEASFKPEPELFPVRKTLADARARQAEQRQGQL